MQLVSFDEVVAESVAALGYLEDEEAAKNFARQWIWRAKMKLATSDTSIQVCKITAKNLLLKKPKNLKQTIEIALYDSGDNYIPHVFHQGKSRIYPNVETFSYDVVLNEGEDDEETVTYTLPIDLSESDTSFVLGTNGTIVEYCLLRYYPMPLDANNEPEVYEHEVEACAAFVRWKWSQRLNQNQSEIAQNRQVWKEEADMAIAKTKTLDFTKEIRKRIGSDLNKMLPNFNRSRF